MRKLVEFPVVEDIYGIKYFITEIEYQEGVLVYLWGNYINKKGKIASSIIFPCEVKRIVKDIRGIFLNERKKQ